MIDLCQNCLAESLPFQTLNDLEFEFTVLKGINVRKDEMDRLRHLKFNPFDTSNNIALSENNANLDKSSKINCEYYLPTDFKEQINETNQNNNFSMIHLNIRSMINKFDSFKELIYSLNKLFQIIGLTETWLNETNEDRFKFQNYDFVNVNRSTKSGGGVGIYIANELNYKIRTDLNTSIENVIESVFVEIITTVGKNIIIGVIYRPPNNHFDSFETEMNQILGQIDKENKLCYLMGDFNIDLLKSESCDYTIRFLEQLFTSSYVPLVLRLTKITQHTATLIDNIFTNDIETIETSSNGLIYSDISDHLPIFHIRNSKTYHEKILKK